MDLKNILIIIVAAVNLFLGFFVFTNGKNKLVNSIYGILSFAVFYWSFGMIFYRIVDSISASIIWCRILYTAPLMIVTSFYYFTLIFPTRNHRKSAKMIFFVILFFCLVLFCLTLFTNRIIDSVVFHKNAEKQIIWGGLYLLYPFVISTAFILSYINLLRNWLAHKGIIRTQIAYVFWGTFLSSTLAMFTNLLLPTFNIFILNWLGQVLSIIMAFFIAYAIIAYRLMDIKIVLRKYSVFLLSVLFISIPAVIIRYVTDYFSIPFAYGIDFFILIGAVAIFPQVRDYFYRLANKYFFSSLYDGRQVIAGLSDKLRSTLDIEMIYHHIADTLMGAFHVKALGILTLEDNEKYLARFKTGFNVEQMEFSGDVKLHNLFIKNNKPIIIEEILHGPYPDFVKKNATVAMLKNIGVEIISPLNVKDKTIGLIALGAKESGDIYNEEDLQVLNVVGAQTAIALDNALLYAETLNFNIKLTEEVKKATRELREANEKLKKLDRAKSDFISIASHQLRTPLTVIKGYISMMLEGSFGGLTKLEEDSLSKVYESNERLIQLVENLLNLSRIESGRLQYNFEKHDLEKTVTSVIEELTGTAVAKGLKLNYKGPKKPLIESSMDIEKIRQVVMNLIDNSIKYTKKGSVNVELDQHGNDIEFNVNDTGMGIDKDDIPNLFRRFSRGKGTSLIHTEGTGLGLYVARKMVEAHSGKIWAESPGKEQGARFCFTIPVK